MTQEIVREFQDRHFKKTERAVSPDKIREDKSYILRNLRVGIELESACSSISRLQESFGVGSDDSRASYDSTEKLVSKVYGDGSISPSGAEVVYKGNSESFEAYHRGLAEVERIIKSHSYGRVNNMSCSAHISLMTAQSRPLPEIYMANLYQLTRKFSDALLWLCGASKEGDWRVRNSIIHFANPLLTASPMVNSMKEIAYSNGKYSAIFFKGEMRWLPDGSSCGFFIEFRFIDRIVNPMALTAIKCMLQAMLFKALELSEFGILNMESEGIENWEKTKRITKRIAEGHPLTTEEKDYLKKKSLNLINFITPNLRTFDGKSIEILKALADRPIHQRYRDGDSDAEIEKALTPREIPEQKTEKELRRIIQLQLVTGTTAGDWEKKVGDILGVSDRMIRHSLNRISEDYTIRFDKEIGGFILIGGN